MIIVITEIIIMIITEVMIVVITEIMINTQYSMIIMTMMTNNVPQNHLTIMMTMEP